MIDLKQISNLEQSAEGGWHSRSQSTVSYPEWGNQACFDIEDSSFWFQHRNVCILEALSQYPPPGPLFDIGAGLRGCRRCDAETRKRNPRCRNTLDCPIPGTKRWTETWSASRLRLIAQGC